MPLQRPHVEVMYGQGQNGNKMHCILPETTSRILARRVSFGGYADNEKRLPEEARVRTRIHPILFISFAFMVILMGCSSKAGDFVGINELALTQLEEIDRIVAEFKPSYDYINVALVYEGRVVLTKTYGRNRLDKVDVYASASKPVTAILFIQLLDRGIIAVFVKIVVASIESIKHYP
jgi:hypothetical protein